MEVTVNSTCARRRRAEGGEVTYRAAAGVHLALRTDNAAGGGAGCESVAHIERREVLEEERDGALHLHACEVYRVGRVVAADAPVHRAPLPCAVRGWRVGASAAHNRRAGVAACGEAACGQVRAPSLMPEVLSYLMPSELHP